MLSIFFIPYHLISSLIDLLRFYFSYPKVANVNTHSCSSTVTVSGHPARHLCFLLSQHMCLSHVLNCLLRDLVIPFM